MPNYRKKNNNNNRNKNKNKNKTKSTSSSSVKQEIQVVESTTEKITKTTTSPSSGIEPNLPADVRNSSYTASAKKSVFEEKNVVVVVNVDEASPISPLSNEEIDGNASNVDIDTFSGSEDTVLTQSNYSSPSTFCSSTSSKKSTEIEDRQLNRAVFNIGDSTLGDSVIRETFVKEVSSDKNSSKTGSANTKDAAASAVDKPTAATTTQSIESTRINESVSEKVRDGSEQRSKSTESATEVIESSTQSSNFSSSKEDNSSKVIVQTTGVDKNASEKLVTHLHPSEESSTTLIVHQISKEDPTIIHEPKSKVIIHREEQSSSTSSSHRATKNGVDLSKKTSTKAAESSTTQTLSFSNVRGQPSREIIYEPRKVILDNFASSHGPSRAIIHQISKEEGFENVNQDNSKVIVHQISREEYQRSSSSNESVITQHTLPQTTDYKSIVHQISPRLKGNQPSSSRSADILDEFGKIIDQSIFEKSFAENISKRFNIDQQDRFTQNVSKKENQGTQTQPLDKNKRVILIPILQENSTQTSPLPSFNENPLHTNLLEIIQDDNSDTRSANKSENIRQTSSSPLSRSPVICFENLSESFELNKNQSEEPSRTIDNTDRLTSMSSPKSTGENSPKVIEHPIVQEDSTQTSPRILQSSRKSPQRADNLEPLKIPSFPITHRTKVIIHPIVNEIPIKPAFPFSEKSLKTIDSSSKEIACQILKEVSSELKSSFLSEITKEKVEKIYSEPIRTSFPVSLKNQASFRPGFFETNKFQMEINPLDSESKVIVHKISTNDEKSTETKTKSDDLHTKKSNISPQKVEEKVIVHQISQEDSNETKPSKTQSNEDKPNLSAYLSSSFPISAEKETHASQYTSRPQDSQQKTIDLQSLRNTAEFRQSSSTMTSTYGLTEMENKKEIIHQILKELPQSDLQKEKIGQPSSISNPKKIPQEESHISYSKSKKAEDSPDSIPKSNLKEDKPKVILHQISRSPSFPLVNELNGELTKKDSTNFKESFPLSALKTNHPEQYNSKSTILEQKTINFEKLRDESKFIQSSATMTSPFSLTLMKEKEESYQTSSPASSHTPFPVSTGTQKRSSFTCQPILINKCETLGFPVSSSSFPMSAEKEKHAPQYSSRPQDSQQKTIDLQSLRDSAEFRQSSSTMTSTYGLTETKDLPISVKKEKNAPQYTSRPQDLQQKTINLQSLRDSAEFRQSSSTMTSTYGLTETENKKEIIHKIFKEPLLSDLQKQEANQPSFPSLSGLSNIGETPSSQNVSSQEHVQKSTDHQSVRESSQVLLSSTKTSTVRQTGTEKIKDQSKEIIHPILRESSASDLQSQSLDQQILSANDQSLSKEKQNLIAEDHQQKSSKPKEIVHQVVKEDSLSEIVPQTKEIIHQIEREHSSSDLQPQTLDHQISQDESISSSEGSVLTAIQNESPRSISPPTAEEPKTKEPSEEKAPTKRSFFLAPLDLQDSTKSKATEVKQDLQMISPEFVKVFNHPIVRQIEKPLGYRVESPQPEKLPMIVKKSKSFDDDDVVIQEMSDTSSAGDTDNPPVVSEAESETDTIEAVDDLSDTPTSSSLLSIQTLPMDHENDNLSPKSSQEYKSRRQQNRAALETHFLPQFLAPNFLDSIKEENSDLSDSDRRSSCSDRVDATVHHGDLDDDVFLDPPKKANAVYPKSNLDFSKKHKHVLNVRPPKTSVIREEASPPSVVEAKIIDQDSIEESCSSWSTDHTPESEAAEVVYIDSASSSVSDLLELDYSQGQPDDSIDIRIQTPTIDLESVNEMFATCQQIKSNDHKIFVPPPSENPPPPPPVNDDATNTSIEKNINEQNLLASHNKNDLPDTTKLKLENETEKCKILDEIISEKIETMSETAGDTHKDSDDVSAAASTSATLVSAENSIANNSNSCDSAIDQIVTSNTSPSSGSTATAAAAVFVVGSIKNNMENIREIVNTASASSKSELDTISTDRTTTDHGFSIPNFMIGQPCSDHTLKCDTTSSTSSSSSSTSSSTTTNTTTTTTTRILTLHDLSQTLDNTKHLNNPLVSPSSSALDRQESLDSHGSDQSHSTNQSQCTAINQGSLTNCDWNEIDTTTDTTYVSESDTAAGLASSEASSPLTTKGGAQTSGDETDSPPIRKLRSLCTEALASMPYGEEVLQELATVAQNIRDMPYPLPDLPQIKDIQLSLGSKPERTSVITLSQVPPRPAKQPGQKFKSPPPPPVPEPPSKYDSWLGVPSESDPNVLVCLSPSQRNAVKSDSTADSLLDMHKKFVERRGYHEYTTKQVNAINQAKTSETPQLSKVDSPPPPPLPPRPSQTQTSNPNGNTDINDDNDDEDAENNHRLLAIIRDTHQSQQQKQHQQISSMTSTSENISRRTESGIHNTVNTSTTKDGGGSSPFEKEFANTPCSVNKQSHERKFISESKKSDSGEMQQSESEHLTKIGGESVMGMKFPSSEYFDSIFDGKNKRFSNIETSSSPQFCSQILATQPKRYSNIETSTFESKKCVENGKVLYDVIDSKREKISEGDQPDAASTGSAAFPERSKTKTNGGLEGSFPFVPTASRSTTDESKPQTGGDSENIMSAFKLNTTHTTAPPAATAVNRVESSPPAPPVPPLPPTLIADTTATSSTMTTKSTSTSESHINRTFNAKTSEKTFDDNGQRAKEAASTTTNSSKNESLSSLFTAKKPSDAFQHEKLFKEFDELSNLLKDELESGKRRPPATLNGNDIPSSVIDYNRVARESKIQNSHVSSTTSTETNRREQMKILADEIDRTSKHKLQQRREMRIPITIEKSGETGPRSAPILSQEPRSYDIPVRTEGGHSSRPNLQHQRSYEIPIRVESSSSGRQRTYSERQSQPRTHEIPIQVEKPTPDRFRRAESMFNISDSAESRHHLHHNDWVKYVGDLGSTENIYKPFQREVEICYLGRRPNIRAPRMSASTSDLSSIQTYDTHGAYDVRRTTQTPRPQQPPRRAYQSTQSLIDTTPITPCVSARRTPAPERRSSLPREIHDKQLQYITSKEQQLKHEFERLENERRNLIDEMNRVQINQRISREAYRQRQLPPLTEDESFRQQMAEEWLNKVAEREERRLQKIIKISKINQEAGVPVAPPRRHSAAADDIGDEFLRRVKERRSKLCMPSDSDWESGAESQPLPRTDGSRSENEEPPVTVFEGQSTTNIKQLPKHLREFAKLTSQMKEEHREEMTENTSTSASKMTALKTTVKTTSNNHSTQESQSMQQDAAHVRDLEQQLSHNGKRPKLVTILRHKKPSTECSGSGGANSNNNCQQQSGGSNQTNSAIKRRKQTRFLLTPNRRSWSESDLLREIDKDLVLAKGFLYANGVWTPKNQTPTSSRTDLNESQPNHQNSHNNNSSSSTNSSPVKERRSENRSSSACGRSQKSAIPTPPPPPLWTPQPERKQFRPVHFESPTLQRKYVQQQSTSSEVPSPPWSYTNSQPFSGYQSQSCTNLSSQKDKAISWPPQPASSSQVVVEKTTTRAIVNEPEDDIVIDDEGFSPTTSIAEKIRSFERSNSNNELHRPLLRHNSHEKPAILKPNEVIFSLKNEYMSEPETEYEKPKKMAQLSRRQYDGIGPTTKHGMPVVLRSEVKEPNQHEWYKRIFQTIHKQKNPDDYVTIRYKCPRGRYPYKANGYMSEPEPNYDSDYSTVKYRTLERRRLQSTGGTESRTSTGHTGNESQDETFYGTMPNPVKSGQGSYKVQPGRIENYITGHSSVSEKEKKEWWDEVMDIFNGQLDQQKLSPHYTEGNLSRALLKEQGYTSDSNLVFRKKDVPILQSPLSPVEQKQVYKSVQAGGQPPLLGFRKPAPEKPKDDDDVPAPPLPPTKGVHFPLDSNGSYNLESPNRYFESDVNIHYKTPIRYEYKDPIPEEELAIRQAETMQKLYQEERRRKYLQELQDMNSRRHTDNFTPSQKSPIPLNRYDDFNSDLAPKSPNSSSYPRTVARALYNFQGQTARELTFKKGDVIYIRRQIDKNWYEGEHNAMIGLLPSNYVELLTKDGIRQPPKKPSEGQARAKYNFQAQSGIELSLNKGEHVTLTRRVDENWYEGKIANRKGIFPVSYVEVLVDIGAEDKTGRLPVTQSIITQSSSSMRPSLDTLRTNINNEFNSLTSNGQPPNGILRETRTLHKTEVLHVDTNTEPVAYRALYKYRPQNTDELELQEGDIVFVLEKCDDGWFVGTSQRSGCFGTFPGNYVERV